MDIIIILMNFMASTDIAFDHFHFRVIPFKRIRAKKLIFLHTFIFFSK